MWCGGRLCRARIAIEIEIRFALGQPDAPSKCRLAILNRHIQNRADKVIFVVEDAEVAIEVVTCRARVGFTPEQRGAEAEGR